MKKTKIMLLAAASLVISGALLFAAVMTVCGWDFRKLNTSEFVNSSYEIAEEFYGVSVDSDTADIVFLPSDDGKCRVDCHEFEKSNHEVSVKDGKLNIKLNEQRKWYEQIFNIGSPKVNIYLPKTEYGALVLKNSTGDVTLPSDFTFESIDITASTGDVESRASAKGQIKIKLSTGDIKIENVTAESLALTVSTGEIELRSVKTVGNVKINVSTGEAELSGVSCKSLISKGTTGDISLNGVIATEKFSIERSTGEVELDGCEAAEIFIKTSTGDVEGTLLSGKDFVAKSNTGDVYVPQNDARGGRCEITTDTGDIKIRIV